MQPLTVYQSESRVEREEKEIKMVAILKICEEFSLRNLQSEKVLICNLSVSYLNAGSIKNKTFGIRDYIISKDVDIMALTETWLYAEEEESATYINEITPHGYNIKEVARQDGRIGGGVAIIYKKGIYKVVVKCSSKSSNLIIDQFEYMVCDVFQTSDSRSKITIAIVYRPSPTDKNGLKLSLFWKDWSKFLRYFAGDHKEVVFLGDLNFHLDNLQHSSTKKFNNTLTQFDFFQLVTKPTHTAGHILDEAAILWKIQLLSTIQEFQIRTVISHLITILQYRLSSTAVSLYQAVK